MENDALKDVLLRVVTSLCQLLEEAGRPVDADLLEQQLEEWLSKTERTEEE